MGCARTVRTQSFVGPTNCLTKRVGSAERQLIKRISGHNPSARYLYRRRHLHALCAIPQVDTPDLVCAGVVRAIQRWATAARRRLSIASDENAGCARVHWKPGWRLREKFGVRPYAVAYMRMRHGV
jgi:hypothetical protein